MPAAAADAVHPAQPAQEENGTGRAIQIARSVAMFVAMQMGEFQPSRVGRHVGQARHVCNS